MPYATVGFDVLPPCSYTRRILDYYFYYFPKVLDFSKRARRIPRLSTSLFRPSFLLPTTSVLRLFRPRSTRASRDDISARRARPSSRLRVRNARAFTFHSVPAQSFPSDETYSASAAHSIHAVLFYPLRPPTTVSIVAVHLLLPATAGGYTRIPPRLVTSVS